MRRRDFIAGLGGTAASPALWPFAARAQQAVPVLGFISTGSSDLIADSVRAFRQGLSETGYVEGRNVAIEFRWAEGRNDRMPALAADLVRRQVAVIAAAGITATAAAKAATTTIPVVFAMGADPVERGFVGSLNRPGGNLTGVTNLNVEVGPKRLDLMHELVPAATDMALLANPSNRQTEPLTRGIEDAARKLGLRLHVVRAATEHDLDSSFASLAQLRAGALVIANDGLFIDRPAQLGVLSARHGVPAIFQSRDFATAGGLVSYGTSLTEQYRQVGIYAGRILKGEKPASLPVQQSTKVEMIVNLKTAKALGINVPLPLLGRADEVIE
jgi:putative ABC transport system substrate-binding protein